MPGNLNRIQRLTLIRVKKHAIKSQIVYSPLKQLIISLRKKQ